MACVRTGEKNEMSRTFEELAGQELDALYQGALFLSGGNERGAEGLLVDAVALAFQEHAHSVDPDHVQRWLEVRLVRAFLRQLTPGPTQLPAGAARRLELAPGTFDSLQARQLFEAAATLPAWPRAALWLVLLRRWSYGDAAEAIGVSKDALVELLRYRDVLIREMMSSARGRLGQDRTGTS